MPTVIEGIQNLCRLRSEAMCAQRLINQPAEQQFSRRLQPLYLEKSVEQRYGRAQEIRDALLKVFSKLPDECIDSRADEELAYASFREFVQASCKVEFLEAELEIGFALRFFLKGHHESLKTLNGLRNEYERHIQDLAATLPALEWWNSIDGCAALGLGLIIGETGDLSNYSGPAKVWKRMGMAPIKGKACSTHRLEKSLSAEEWTSAGYSPRRRSVMFTIGKALIFQNGDGVYKTYYNAEKARTKITHPEWWNCGGCAGTGKSGKRKCEKCAGKGQKPGHADRHAQRLMEKRLLRDLWCVWNGREVGLRSNDTQADFAVLA